MKLRAARPILYRSTQYGVGDVLPADNQAMVEAWLSAGSAAWGEDEEAPAPKAPKARLATAEPGLSGRSSDGDPEALVGRIPKTPERGKPKPRRKASK